MKVKDRVMNYVGVGKKKKILLTTKKQTPQAQLYCCSSATQASTNSEVSRQNSFINAHHSVLIPILWMFHTMNVEHLTQCSERPRCCQISWKKAGLNSRLMSLSLSVRCCEIMIQSDLFACKAVCCRFSNKGCVCCQLHTKLKQVSGKLQSSR